MMVGALTALLKNIHDIIQQIESVDGVFPDASKHFCGMATTRCSYTGSAQGRLVEKR